jgi:hypothetical protein
VSNPDLWRSSIHVAILHPERPAVLVEQSGAAWRVPTVPVERIWEKTIDSVSAAARETLGLEATALQLLHGLRDEAASTTYRFYVMENHSPDWPAPPNWRTWSGPCPPSSRPSSRGWRSLSPVQSRRCVRPGRDSAGTPRPAPGSAPSWSAWGSPRPASPSR